MVTAGAMPCPGEVREVPALVASASLVRSLSALKTALAALALAEEMRRSNFFAMVLALSAAATIFLTSTALAFVSFAALR
jgi:hypothetical protein